MECADSNYILKIAHVYYAHMLMVTAFFAFPSAIFPSYVIFQTNWLLIGCVEIPPEYTKTTHKCPYVTLPVRILGVICAGDETRVAMLL